MNKLKCWRMLPVCSAVCLLIMFACLIMMSCTNTFHSIQHRTMDMRTLVFNNFENEHLSKWKHLWEVSSLMRKGHNVQHTNTNEVCFKKKLRIVDEGRVKYKDSKNLDKNLKQKTWNKNQKQKPLWGTNQLAPYKVSIIWVWGKLQKLLMILPLIRSSGHWYESDAMRQTGLHAPIFGCNIQSGGDFIEHSEARLVK